MRTETEICSPNRERAAEIAELLGSGMIAAYFNQPFENWPISKLQRAHIAALYDAHDQARLVEIIEDDEFGVTTVHWTITCTCKAQFSDALLSLAEKFWRMHAGVSERTRVNDAHSLSK